MRKRKWTGDLRSLRGARLKRVSLKQLIATHLDLLQKKVGEVFAHSDEVGTEVLSVQPIVEDADRSESTAGE